MREFTLTETRLKALGLRSKVRPDGKTTLPIGSHWAQTLVLASQRRWASHEKHLHADNLAEWDTGGEVWRFLKG
jgi:hypothetical protein